MVEVISFLSNKIIAENTPCLVKITAKPELISDFEANKFILKGPVNGANNLFELERTQRTK
jgi:hypothetical protein